jgi:hypothetical protein
MGAMEDMERQQRTFGRIGTRLASLIGIKPPVAIIYPFRYVCFYMFIKY